MAAKFDVSAAFRASARLRAIGREAETVDQRAASTLVRRLKPEAVRDIKSTHNLPAARIRENVDVRLVGNAVELIGAARGVTLASYGAKWTKATGVRVTTEIDEGVKVFRHMFIRPGLSNNRLVFQRRRGEKVEPKKGRYAGTGIKREPLDAKYGPSIATALRDRSRAERLEKFSMNVLAAEARRLVGVFHGVA